MQYPINKRDRAILAHLATATRPVLAIFWCADEKDMKAIRKLIRVGFVDLVPHPTIMGGYEGGVRQGAEALVITDDGRTRIA